MKLKKNKKIFEYVFTFFIIISLNFALPRMMPGDPFLHNTGGEGEVFTSHTMEQIQYYREYYGLDKPIHLQYWNYLKELFNFDLGYSYYYKTSVIDIISKRLPWTILLVITALIFSLIIGILLGSFSAWRRNGWQDQSIYLILIVISEIPAFLIGIFLLVIFAAGFNLFPLAGSISHFVDYSSRWGKIIDIAKHAFLPVMTLTIARTGGIYLLVRSSLSTVLTKDYIRTAKAKGLKEIRVKYMHALGNSILPLITRVSMQLGAMVGGSVLAESVFSYPGLGLLMRSAVSVRDYPLIQGIFLVLALMVMSTNFIADLLYKKIDPRV